MTTRKDVLDRGVVWSGSLPVDAHVHLHDMANVPKALDAAVVHLSRHGSGFGGLRGALLLAQMSHEQVFEQLLQAGRAGSWSFESARDEEVSLFASNGDSRVLLVCGRQLRAEDGLEILALGTRQVFLDGQPFAAALDAVIESGALAVLPWGFGKWSGRRGQRVLSAARAVGPRKLLLGDSGGRWGPAGVPSIIRVLTGEGFRVLPGTDPLVVRSDFRRTGRFGFLCDAALNLDCPWRSLRSWIDSRSNSPAGYGRACGVLEFAGNQLAMRLPRPVRAS